ncbi:MAG: hypothetical protein A4E55_00917 [Pelotomaculum sp. PtaU1.Bin035]|nr:MAG: hypothetical protein A4E55_00917 [Pelotomaculum sp. PtaU1.Bin035]
MSQPVIILLIVTLLGLIGKNGTVAAAAGILLVLRLIIPERPPYIEEYTLKAGITIITLAVLLPFATGEVGFRSIMGSFRSALGLVAVLVGVGIAYLGGRGMSLLTNQPQVLVGLLIGTIIGVAFFKGVPVGPLIGAGIVALVISTFKV